MNFKGKGCKNKGITLIALVITIIVLLILAGVTIAMLSGDNSAPQKATEAAQKDAIAGAKDEIAMEVQEALLNYYNNTYVEGDGTKEKSIQEVVSGAASTAVGNAKKRNSQLLESSGVSGNKITLETKSYTTTGTIDTNGGITWSDIVALTENGSEGETTIKDAAKKGLLKVGDYVAYTPDTIGNPKTVNGKTVNIETLSEKTYTAQADNTGYEKNQTIEQEKLNWRIFSIDESTGEVLLISETPTHRALALKGSVGWLNAENELNNACRELYSNSKLGDARHITVDDINKEVGYSPDLKEESTDRDVYYPDKDGEMQIESDRSDYLLKKLKHGVYKRPAEMTPYQYSLLDKSANQTFTNMLSGKDKNGEWYYETSNGESSNTPNYTHWLASRSVSFFNGLDPFFNVYWLGYEQGGIYDSEYIFPSDIFWNIKGGDGEGWCSCRSPYGSLRPIVTLNSRAQINTEDGQEEHNTQETAWQIH